jgi:hypothetical protein
MKTNFLIILLIFQLVFNVWHLCYITKHNLEKPIKCDVDKRIEFIKGCINTIDLIHQPQSHDATSVIRQCEETSQNLYCTY